MRHDWAILDIILRVPSGSTSIKSDYTSIRLVTSTIIMIYITIGTVYPMGHGQAILDIT